MHFPGRHHIDPTMPRRAGRQQHRENVAADTPSDYWKRAMYAPLVDHLVMEMREKLIDRREAFCGQYLISTSINELTPGRINSIFQAFQHDLTGRGEFDREITRWIARCTEWEEEFQGPMPSTLMETIIHTPKQLYRNCYTIVKTLLTYPVTTASNERSFSAMKRVKSYLRATMGQQRLSSFALLHIHKNKQINVDDVINRFAGATNRRLALVLEGRDEAEDQIDSAESSDSDFE